MRFMIQRRLANPEPRTRGFERFGEQRADILLDDRLRCLAMALALPDRAAALAVVEMTGITTPFTTPAFPFVQTVSQPALDTLTPAFTLAGALAGLRAAAGSEVAAIPGLGPWILSVLDTGRGGRGPAAADVPIPRPPSL